MKTKSPRMRGFTTYFRLSLMGILGLSTIAIARPPQSAEFKAAETIGEDIADWAVGLKPTPKSIGIFSINASAPYDPDYAGIMETEILKQLSKKGLERLGSCSECRSPQLKVEGEKLIIRKGIPDTDTLKTIGDRQPYEVFLAIDIYNTGFNVVTQVSAYKNHSGEMLGTERFSAPAVTLNNTSVQLLVTAAIGKPIDSSSAATDYMIAPNIALLEEVGFGKAGLAIGTVLGGVGGLLLYMDPTIQFMGRFGSTGIAWGFSIGAGLGIAASGKCPNFRLAYEVFLGSWTVIGLDGTYFLPSPAVAGNTQSFAGLHLGFALGR